MEHSIRAGNIVPKPLPHVTPDACPSPNPPFGYRGSTPTPRLIPGVKRKYIDFTEKTFFFKLKKLQFHEFFNFFAEEANSWQSNRPQVNRNRNTNNRGRRQSRPVTTVETNPALAALTLPPKERPDAKHHLKVIIFF